MKGRASDARLLAAEYRAQLRLPGVPRSLTEMARADAVRSEDVPGAGSGPAPVRYVMADGSSVCIAATWWIVEEDPRRMADARTQRLLKWAERRCCR